MGAQGGTATALKVVPDRTEGAAASKPDSSATHMFTVCTAHASAAESLSAPTLFAATSVFVENPITESLIPPQERKSELHT